jgi:hypothetical protein
MSFVRMVQNGIVRIQDDGDIDPALLEQLGGCRTPTDRSQWTVQVTDDEALAHALSHLRDAGIPMAGGHGWPPSAVFAHLRDAGLLSGPYQEIVWSGPDQPWIVTHE